MQKVNRWSTALLAGSWFVFALIVLFYQPVWTGTVNILRCLIGLLGTGFVCTYLFLDRRWLIYATLSSAGVLLLTYLGELVVRVLSYVAIDPELGLLRTIWLKVSTPFLVSQKLAIEGSMLQAFIELYWTTGMPVLQLILGAILIWNIRSIAPSSKATTQIGLR